jgi:hypothetical protein
MPIILLEQATVERGLIVEMASIARIHCFCALDSTPLF